MKKMEKPKVHSFKFSRNDLINALRRQGITSYSNTAIDEAMKQVSLTLAIEYVKLSH